MVRILKTLLATPQIIIVFTLLFILFIIEGILNATTFIFKSIVDGIGWLIRELLNLINLK
jgi:hypothetical protein